jgi:hypothetical protein
MAAAAWTRMKLEQQTNDSMILQVMLPLFIATASSPTRLLSGGQDVRQNHVGTKKEEKSVLAAAASCKKSSTKQSKTYWALFFPGGKEEAIVTQLYRYNCGRFDHHHHRHCDYQ